MELKVTKVLNKTTQVTVTGSGDDLEQCLFQLSVILNAPAACGKCNSENIFIYTRKVHKDNKTYAYCGYGCRECGARLPWGVFNDGTGNFFLKDWEEPYDPNSQQQEGNGSSKPTGKKK